MTVEGSLRPIPPWRLIVLVVAAAGAVAVALAVAGVVTDGVTRLGVAAAGLVSTAVVNRIYVVVTRRGQVLEAIDLAEGPIVALALLLPPSEALLTFVLASLLVELPIDRAPIKKAFNVGIRAMGAGVLLLPVALVGTSPDPDRAQYVAAAVGGVGYTAVNALAVAAVVASVQRRRMTELLGDGIGVRVVVASAAIVTGLCAGYTALHKPVALAGVAALLAVVVFSARSARRAQVDRERLHHLLEASTRIQGAHDPAEQEAVLLEAAHELLLWRDVSIREAPPEVPETGAALPAHDGRERWLIVSPRPDSDPWREQDSQILHALAAAASAALDRVRLQAELARQARLDPLTGLSNRRAFDEEMAALRAGSRFSIAVCDLDGFKAVNDRLGHDTGDELLQVVAARLAASVRHDDLVARVGGDEFIVVLRDVDVREALAIADKIRDRLAEPVRIGRWHLSCIPASVGVATSSFETATPRAVLQTADEAMYAAKRRRAQSQRPAFTVTVPGADNASALIPRSRHVTDALAERD